MHSVVIISQCLPTFPCRLYRCCCRANHNLPLIWQVVPWRRPRVLRARRPLWRTGLTVGRPELREVGAPGVEGPAPRAVLFPSLFLEGSVLLPREHPGPAVPVLGGVSVAAVDKTAPARWSRPPDGGRRRSGHTLGCGTGRHGGRASLPLNSWNTVLEGAPMGPLVHADSHISGAGGCHCRENSV